MAQSTKPGKVKGTEKAKEDVMTSTKEIKRTSLFLKNIFIRAKFIYRNVLFYFQYTKYSQNYYFSMVIIAEKT